jgi:hypothetical protein
MYPKEIVIPMKEELTDNGFSELLTRGSRNPIRPRDYCNDQFRLWLCCRIGQTGSFNGGCQFAR